MSYLVRRLLRPTLNINVTKLKYTRSFVRTVTCDNNLATSKFTCSSLQSCSVFYNNTRSKSKKAQYDSDDDDDEDYSNDSSLKKDSKLVKLSTTSLRVDLILKQALGIARNKIEQQFYESKIRVNGKKILKKSASVRQGDEIDIIKMVSPKNPDHLYVFRVEVLNIAAQEESITITARRFKNLLIENYETDPYKGHSSASDTQ